MSIWVLWHPVYAAEGVIKLVTAIASIVAAVSLWKIMPHALALPGMAALATRLQQQTAALTSANQRLSAEIAERQRAERELAQSERRFREFADIASDWLWEIDAEDRFTYVSARVDEIAASIPAS